MASTLLNGLVATWKLDDAASANRVDSGPQGLTLTKGGTVGSVPGRINHAASFGPSGGVLYRTADNGLIPPAEDAAWTVTLWYKIAYDHTDTDDMQLVGVWRSNWVYTQQAWRFYLDYELDSGISKWRARMEWQKITDPPTGPGTMGAVNSEAHAGLGDWRFIAIGVDGIQGVTVYSDGVDFQHGETDTIGVRQPETTPLFTVGTDSTGGVDEFDGELDNVTIHNRLLSDSEIEQVYNNGAGLAYPFTLNWRDLTLDQWKVMTLDQWKEFILG